MAVDTHPITESARITVEFPIDRVWGAMKSAYDSLGIPIGTMDQASHTIGNNSLRIRRRLGDVSMSKYVNCGNVQGVQSADSYEVMASIMTRLEPVSGAAQTSLVTSIEAHGRPMTIASDDVLCPSTGRLEKRIAELVTAQIKR
jgi:hypothetical protein